MNRGLAFLAFLVTVNVLAGRSLAGPEADRAIENLQEMKKTIASQPATTERMKELRDQELARIEKRLKELRGSQFETAPPREYRESVELYGEARKCSASLYIGEFHSVEVRSNVRRSVRRGYADAVRKMDLAIKAWPGGRIPDGWYEMRIFLYRMRAKELRESRDVLAHHAWTKRMRKEEAVRLEKLVRKYRRRSERRRSR